MMALGLTLYPVISNYVNQKYASEIFTAYQEVIAQTDNTVLLQERGKAIAYNQTLIPRTGSDGSYTQEALQSASGEYNSMLNLAGDGIMGYIEIPKINVHLPIYHGTGDSSLSKGVGHLLGSSLPVGGESTHSILSGHSGMASQTMFTDLEQLGIGDVFYLYVLGDVLAYQVMEINTVLPSDTSLLGIWEGEDCCTLVTCTPYGVNTHRLLITGSRIPYEEAEQITVQMEVEDSTGSHWMQYYLRGLEIGLAVVAGFLVAALLLFLLWKWVYGRLHHG
jgi:sortase A